MADSKLLDQVFKAKEEDVKYFSDIIATEEYSEEKTYGIKSTASYKDETQNLIGIVHGYHEDNYVWHIKPVHGKKPWKVSMQRVVFAIGKVVSTLLPQDLMLDVFLPQETWDIKEITVKANNVKEHWAVRESDLDKVTGQFFEVLNTLV